MKLLIVIITLFIGICSAFPMLLVPSSLPAENAQPSDFAGKAFPNSDDAGAPSGRETIPNHPIEDKAGFFNVPIPVLPSSDGMMVVDIPDNDVTGKPDSEPTGLAPFKNKSPAEHGHGPAVQPARLQPPTPSSSPLSSQGPRVDGGEAIQHLSNLHATSSKMIREAPVGKLYGQLTVSMPDLSCSKGVTNLTEPIIEKPAEDASEHDGHKAANRRRKIDDPKPERPVDDFLKGVVGFVSMILPDRP